MVIRTIGSDGSSTTGEFVSHFDKAIRTVFILFFIDLYRDSHLVKMIPKVVIMNRLLLSTRPKISGTWMKSNIICSYSLHLKQMNA